MAIPLNSAGNAFCDRCRDQSDMVPCGFRRQSCDPSVSFANMEVQGNQQTGKESSVSPRFYHTLEPLRIAQANNAMSSGFPKRTRTILG